MLQISAEIRDYFNDNYAQHKWLNIILVVEFGATELNNKKTMYLYN